jgi:hypothetical protein
MIRGDGVSPRHRFSSTGSAASSQSPGFKGNEHKDLLPVALEGNIVKLATITMLAGFF